MFLVAIELSPSAQRRLRETAVNEYCILHILKAGHCQGRGAGESSGWIGPAYTFFPKHPLYPSEKQHTDPVWNLLCS